MGSPSSRTLPADLTPFIGRREEAADVRRLLESSRLLTLTGPGGIGKTRLALHTARTKHRAFPGGVWSVDLSTLTDPSLLPQTVSAAMGLPDVSSTSRTEALIDYLSDRQGLLLLDNCEHLVDSCAQLARALLRASESLRILTTSRQPLGVEGEQIFQVPPFTVPLETSAVAPAEALLRYESVSLFVSRAQAVFPGFRLDAGNGPLVARLCRDLEGIPLAIELAAVRLRSLSVEEIVARLDDRFQLLTIGHQGPGAVAGGLAGVLSGGHRGSPPPRRRERRAGRAARRRPQPGVRDLCPRAGRRLRPRLPGGEGPAERGAGALRPGGRPAGALARHRGPGGSAGCAGRDRRGRGAVRSGDRAVRRPGRALEPVVSPVDPGRPQAPAGRPR
ncbi:AAA family ATPase [Acrocarpospora sp. B8E8]|uniref:ATP-binding protein n=1 Tax=Acrocarpospora sp. B8E8 TaxID=3153572 RepID=UPI00325F76E6